MAKNACTDRLQKEAMFPTAQTVSRAQLTNAAPLRSTASC